MASKKNQIARLGYAQITHLQCFRDELQTSVAQIAPDLASEVTREVNKKIQKVVFKNRVRGALQKHRFCKRCLGSTAKATAPTTNPSGVDYFEITCPSCEKVVRKEFVAPKPPNPKKTSKK